ncbi:UNKNOWN [Stylonychia lemnae]|uniref:Nucleoporin Nup133/Nup155-like N-terminal domain-containing protein n=1 Tax=Stylonychia lemnae TaxID=5949 RepID=A0A078AZW1_STYLE|nr:UNKNOWN [Stylonychia lemnae]|eukprot:CDW87945.1 UNKNOWN [Stylonychia lemnae]
MYKPGKSFMPNYGEIQLTNMRKSVHNAEQSTPKAFGYGKDNQKGYNPKEIYLNNPSSLFASSFAKDKQVQNAKKRMYSEISNEIQQPSPYIGTPYMTFDDNSTIKPNQNTIVRNPTLMSLGIGRDDQSRGLIKSASIKPMNLNLTDYQKFRDASAQDEQFYEDHYIVNGEQILPTQTFKPKRVDKHLEQFSKAEINTKCQQVSQILDHIYHINSNPLKNDIALVNSRGLQFEYQPLQYIVANQQQLPPEIQTMIGIQYHESDIERRNIISDIGIFETLQVGYYFQNQNLYMWPYAFPGRYEVGQQRFSNLNKIRAESFDQAITCVAVCEPLPEMLLEAQENKILIVSTAIELIIFTIKRDKETNDIQMNRTNYKIPTDGDMVEKIAQFKKNNRIFYGGSEGHINEINLKSNKLDQFLENISLAKKKLKRNDYSAGSFLEKLLPSFIVDRSRKKIVDIKFDDSRNYLYSMAVSLDRETQGQAEIDVYDLGVFGNQFNKVVSIKQYEILEAFISYQKISIFGKGFDILKLSENFKIIFIQPILTNESEIHHLLLVTESGDRIYLSFDQYDIDIKKQDQYLNLDAIVDFYVTSRFKKDWIIREVLKFPKIEETEELFDVAQRNGAFKCIGANVASQPLLINKDSLFYDNQESCVIYTENIFDQDNLIPQAQQIIKFSFIRKNESTFAALKAQNSNQGQLQIAEQCSQFDLIVLPPRSQASMDPLDPRQYQFDMQENIYSIKSMNSYRQSELQKLLGYDRTYKDYKGQSSTVQWHYMCQDQYDKQIYLDQRRYQIMTDQRVLEVLEVRPIDQLVMILHTLTRPHCNTFEDFEDFIDLHTFKEVCAMLVQIISDRNGRYLFSRRIEQMICTSNKQKNRKLTQSQPRQTLRNLIAAGPQIVSHQSPIRLNNQKISYQTTSYVEFKSQYELKRFVGPNFIGEYVYQRCTQEVRLLRPFLDLNIFYTTFLETGKEVCLPSIESLTFTQEKLSDLLEFIIKNYPQLQGETLKSEEFLDYETNSFIRYDFLRERVILVDELQSDDKYNLEFWSKLRKDQQIQVTQLSFRELLSNANNNVIKDILNVLLDQEKLIKVPAGQRQTAQFSSSREGQIQLLYNQMFTKEEVKAFKGERLLVEAINEKDNHRRDQLLEMSLRQMCEEPVEIDLNAIAPLLVQIGNFTSLVEITLNKIIVLKNTPVKELKNMDESLADYYIDQGYQLIMQVISAIDYSLRKDDSKFLEKIMNSKDQSLLDIMIKKLNKVQDDKLKINLRTNILRRIEQVGDIILLSAIFEYQLKKPKTIFDMESFPKISKEAFESICDHAILSDSIQKDYLNSLVTLLCQKEEAKRLCDLVLNVCNNRQIVYLDSDSQTKLIINEGDRVPFNLVLDERLKLLNKAETLLETSTKKFDGSDSQMRYQSLINQCIEKAKLQVEIMKSLEEIKQAYQAKVELFEQNYRHKNKKDKALEDKELEKNRLEQIKIKNLNIKKDLLDQKIFEVKDLLQDFVHDENLFEVLLIHNLTSSESKQRDSSYQNSIVQQWVNQIFHLYSHNDDILMSKIKQKLTSLTDNENKSKAIPKYIQATSNLIEKQFKQEDTLINSKTEKEQNLKNLLEDLKSLNGGFALVKTRFWFYEYCFSENNENQLKLKASQLINYFSNQPQANQSNWELSSNQQPFKFEISNDDQLFKFLCLMKLWIKNGDLYKEKKLDQNNISDQQSQTFYETPYQIFHQDVKLHAKSFYTELIMSTMKDYIDYNYLAFHKEVKHLVDELYNKVENGFKQMLISHGIKLLLPGQINNIATLNTLNQNKFAQREGTGIVNNRSQSVNNISQANFSNSSQMNQSLSSQQSIQKINADQEMKQSLQEQSAMAYQTNYFQTNVSPINQEKSPQLFNQDQYAIGTHKQDGGKSQPTSRLFQKQSDTIQFMQ